MSSSLYQAGDYVYIETSSTTPYQIRRIEDFKLGAEGPVEAKVTCVYRRTNLPPSLISLADTLHAADVWPGGEPTGREGALRRHLSRQRELFPSRQTELVPVTRIRGRCSVGLLSGAEQPHHYLEKENSFYYCLLFDPAQRSLVADRGEIRVGEEYQAASPADRCPLRPGEPDLERAEPLETLLWTPGRIDDAEVDTFLRLARSVGTLARALDPSVTGRCGASLHLAAAAAGRDATTQHALDALHAADYRLPAALSGLVAGRRAERLTLCRDQLDAWTVSEAQLFEKAMNKCGKAFGDIRRDFLPWKSTAQLVEYYYLWKTADRYLRRRLTKAAAASGRPIRLLLPDCGRWEGAEGGQMSPDRGHAGGPACAGCSASRASRWFAWGWRRLCGPCWLHWRRYGGLRRPPTRDAYASATERRPLRPPPPIPRPPAAVRTGCARRRPDAAAVGRGLALPTFQVRPPPLLLLARRLCAARLRLRRLARCPLRAVSGPATQAQCLQLLSELSEEELERLAAAGGGAGSSAARRRRRCRTERLLPLRTGQSAPSAPGWPVAGERAPPPVREAFPRPPKAPDGSIIYTPVRSRPPTAAGRLRGLSLDSPSALPGSPVLRVRRPSISQTAHRRSSAS
ncbi:metastasis-associated protein MTA3-like [Amphibalanus amphitrite]|uniref:metastasis-associated protein MTA3-like n=1 Tax=Amphibalanus amphitrite TaxID=1232801 RepID=UPI001C9143EB|nr:metastasis-associated protein MTA3-like [Amphibalanus amphitrite]